MSRNIISQDVGMHLASIKTVFHPLLGNVRLSHACQVNVNAGKGQTYVFMSIILHNNAASFFSFFFTRDKKEKTDVIKGHPVASNHIWRNVYL